MRSVWVSIFWLTPAIVRDSSLYLRGASASAVRTSVTHLSLSASSTTQGLGGAVRRVVPAGVHGALDAGLVGMPALDAVRDKGAFVAVAAGAAPVPLRGTRVHNVWIHTDGPRLAELAAHVDAGKLTPRVAATLPLDQVAAAHQRVAAGGLRGRIVLTLDN